MDELSNKLLKPRRCNSMDAIKGEIESDPREIRSEPPNPKPDWDQDGEPKNLALDNVYAESKLPDPTKPKKSFTDAESQVNPEEFRVITRKGVDFITLDGAEQSMYRKRKDKNKKRGRKNQYYTQIDAEDDEEAEHLEETQKEVKFTEDEKDLGVIKEEANEEEKTRNKKLGKRSGREMESHMRSLEAEKAKKDAEEADRRKREELEAKRLEDEIAQRIDLA